MVRRRFRALVDAVGFVAVEDGHEQGDEWQMRQLGVGLVVWFFVGRVSEDAELLIEIVGLLVVVFAE